MEEFCFEDLIIYLLGCRENGGMSRPKTRSRGMIVISHLKFKDMKPETTQKFIPLL